MSTTKTMGTNPLATSYIEEETLTFIPDRRKNQQRMNRSTKQRNRNTAKKHHKGKSSDRIRHTNTNGSPSNNNGSMDSSGSGQSKKSKKTEKKIASYSLDVELLQQVRKLAQKQDRYYSSIVSEALENLIQQYTNRYGKV